MTTKFLWDADATQSTDLISLPGPGAPTIVSDFVHGGHARSLKFKDTSSGDNADFGPNVLPQAGGRFSFYIYWNALPAATNPGNSTIFINSAKGDTGTDILKWRFDNVGVTRMFTGGGGSGQLGSNGSQTFATGAFRRISGAYTITNTTTHSERLWVDGVLSITNTNTGTLDTLPGAALFFNIGTNGDTATDFRISDLYLDDSTSLTDPASDVWVTSKRPNANGTTNGFTTQIGAGGSGYGTGHSPQVNELPLSQTNGWSMIGAGSAITEEYSVEGASVGQIDVSAATLIDWGSWVFAKSALSETGSIIVGGTTSNIALTSTATPFQAFKGSSTYPAGSTDVGVVTSTTVTTVSLYECGVMVAYTPGVAGGLPFFIQDDGILHGGFARKAGNFQ